MWCSFSSLSNLKRNNKRYLGKLRSGFSSIFVPIFVLPPTLFPLSCKDWTTWQSHQRKGSLLFLSQLPFPLAPLFLHNRWSLQHHFFTQNHQAHPQGLTDQSVATSNLSSVWCCGCSDSGNVCGSSGVDGGSFFPFLLWTFF